MGNRKKQIMADKCIEALNSVIDIIDAYKEEMQGQDTKNLLKSYREMTDDIINIVEDLKKPITKDEILANEEFKEKVRVVPLQPEARARYVINHLRRDVDRCLACQKYNLQRHVDIKKNGIKYWIGVTQEEYTEILRDYNFIKSQLHGKLKKHKPVFEELIMKDRTLEEYADFMFANRGKKMPQAYSIKWSFNKKESLIKAIAKCYASEMASMNYYNGIQKENAEYDGRDYYMVEREIVSDALSEVDKHQKEYFLAMKEAYEEIYETVESMRKESKEKPDISFI